MKPIAQYVQQAEQLLEESEKPEITAEETAILVQRAQTYALLALIGAQLSERPGR